jgi:hypothetical protein
VCTFELHKISSFQFNGKTVFFLGFDRGEIVRNLSRRKKRKCGRGGEEQAVRNHTQSGGDIMEL